jgi:phosphatidylserine decarboxylase
MIPAVLTALLFLSGINLAGIVGAMTTLAVIWFFRDPERVSRPLEGEVLCPADGRVVAVNSAGTTHTDAEGFKVSVFMSVFNVHINRVPVDGRILSVRHVPGGFAMAHLDDAGVTNERTEILLEDDTGKRYLVVQIAGLLARRIICRLEKGDAVKAGQRFGLICFGSRVDLYMPSDASPLVKMGDRVRGGLSILAKVS